MKKNIKLLLFPVLFFGIFSISISLFNVFFVSNQKSEINTIDEKNQSNIEKENTFPYIIDFEIVETTEESVSFAFQINDDLDYVAKEEIGVKFVGDNQSYVATKIEDDKISEGNIWYKYKVDSLESNQDYTFYSLLNSGLATIEDPNNIADEILFSSSNISSNTDFSFSSTGNPYLMKNSFLIENVSENNITFSIKFFQSSVQGPTLSNNKVKIYKKGDENSKEEYDTNFINQYVNDEIVTLFFDIDNSFPIEEEYVFYSLSNFSLATSPGGPIIGAEEEIILENNLGESEESLTFAVPGNAYIEEDYFNILDIERNSVQFQLKVHDNYDSTFGINRNLNIVLVDEEGNNETYIATFVEQDAQDISTYEINDLAFGTDYTFLSIEDSPFALSNATNEVGNSIKFVDNLCIDESELTFHTIGNSYIEEGGFEILEDSITNTTVDFSIKVNQIEDDDFDFSSAIDVTLKNIEDNIDISTEAILVNNNLREENTYTYRISDLDPDVEYQIISLDNSNLALDTDSNEKSETISVIDDLGYDETFTTDTNPFVEPNGFKIEEDSITKSSFEFSLIVNNWSDPKQTLTVGILENGNEEPTFFDANLIGQDNNTYRYKVDGLEEDSNYIVYSIVNPGFALNASGGLADEILLENYLSDDVLAIQTVNVLDPFIIIMIVLIVVLIFIAILLFVYIKKRKRIKLMKSALKGV